jgi:hypothetical protein
MASSCNPNLNKLDVFAPMIVPVVMVDLVHCQAVQQATRLVVHGDDSLKHYMVGWIGTPLSKRRKQGVIVFRGNWLYTASISHAYLNVM